MDDGLCSCEPHQKHTNDEDGYLRTIFYWVYDPMCLVHGQFGIS